jgi:hypothetical protein
MMHKHRKNRLRVEMDKKEEKKRRKKKRRI